MHPLSGDLSVFKDQELETKINDLTKKYFMTNNMEIRQQMSMLLESYKSELSKRQQAALEKLMASRDKTLDKLINVS
jgi:hypothetical protein